MESAAAAAAAAVNNVEPVTVAAASGSVREQELSHIHVFRDSNTQTTPQELKTYFANIVKNDNKSNNTQFHLHEAYTLEEALRKATTLQLYNNDHIIITSMTNNARTTKSGRHSTPFQTAQIQTKIINTLNNKIPRHHITFLEAPPLLINETTDIYPYNRASSNVANKYGVNFAATLIGEEHIWRNGPKADGFHIQHRHRHLLHRSIAAAAARVNPHTHYKLIPPPFGPFGPWRAPSGVGLIPAPVPSFRDIHQFPPLPGSYCDMAASHPIHFRRRFPQMSAFSPLNTNIRRPS